MTLPKGGTKTNCAVLLDDQYDLKPRPRDVPIISLGRFLRGPDSYAFAGTTVIIVSGDYSYLGKAYHCSLLVEARGGKPVPTVDALYQLARRRSDGRSRLRPDLHLGKGDQYLADLGGSRRRCLVFLGEARDKWALQLAGHVFRSFPCPVLEVGIRHYGRSRIISVRPVGVTDLGTRERRFLVQAIEKYARRNAHCASPKGLGDFRLGVLLDPSDKLPPICPDGLKILARAGRSLGVSVEKLQERDLPRLYECDGLFIRTTDAYHFAVNAARLGIPVLDDPVSILRCNNKVFVTDLLRSNRLPIPRTVFVDDVRQVRNLERKLLYPVVVKLPHLSGGMGVFRAGDREQLESLIREQRNRSGVFLVQEYIPTQFDWRVGVLGGEVLFVCQYYMAAGGWKILEKRNKHEFVSGCVKTLGHEEWPSNVVSLALAASRLIGNGLYGVDLKEHAGQVLLTDINDCPDLNHGDEDFVLRDDLWRRIIKWFLEQSSGMSPLKEVGLDYLGSRQ